MFDFVYRHRRALQLILALIIIPPFAFFGVDSYLRNSDAVAPIATVNGQSIGQQEFNISLRERQEMMQNMSGGKMDAAMLDSAEMRFAVAESLVTQKVLLQHGSRSGLLATDQQLQSLLSQVPALQEAGKFSHERYEQFLKSRNRTAVDFEMELRRDMVLQQVNDAYGESNFLPRTVVQRLSRLMETQREASTYTLVPDKFVAKVAIEADAVKKYYDSQQAAFRTPEQVRVEYVVLSIDALLPAVKVDPEEVKRAFDDQAKRVQVQESRQASHLLIAVDAKATAEEKQKARAKAADLLKQVKAKPASFAELAKANSQDPGSAANGGDLGSFKRADMTKAFADAAFGMKVGDISDLVETEYGLHIIKLTGITEAKAPTFEAMRGQIETDLKRAAAGKDFAAKAEQFNDLVFTQSESLKPAADLAKSAVQQSDWFSRNMAGDARLKHPKLQQAIFSDDVLKNKRNTEAVEVTPGTLVAARLLEHKPSVVRPFDEVKAGIETRLTQQRAAQLAAQEGRALLESLRQGKPAEVAWSAPQMVNFSSRIKGLDEEVQKQILRADSTKLPAYAGVESPAGYTLIRITRAIEPEKIDAEKEKNLAQAMQQAQGQEQNAAFLASLKQKADVKIRKEQIGEKKDK